MGLTYRQWMTTMLIALSLHFAPICHGANWAFWQDEPIQVKVTKPYIEMRTGPGRGYAIFHVAEKGETIQLTKQKNRWFKVTTRKGQTGWVDRDQLSGNLTTESERLALNESSVNHFNDRKWMLSVLLGDFSGADSFSALVAYQFNPVLAAELTYSNHYGDFSNSSAYHARILSTPFTGWKLTPYFGLGTGRLSIAPDPDLVQSEDRQEGLMNVSAGLYYPVYNQFVLRAEFIQHTVLTNRENHEKVNEWKTGFSIHF